MSRARSQGGSKNWDEIGQRATGMPGTWRKTKRLTKHQRFRTYNPLKMDFYTKPSFAAVGSRRRQKGFKVNLNEAGHVAQVKHEAYQLRKEKLEHNRRIQDATRDNRGSVRIEGTERVFDTSQSDIIELTDHNTARKVFDLNLDSTGPYCVDYTSNGEYLAIGGRRGHLALLRWQDLRLVSEQNLFHHTNASQSSDSVIYDMCFCMNESMIATAQCEGVYIYNAKLEETHVLRRSMLHPLSVTFLKHHFLLCSIGRKGRLVWFDVSTGNRVTSRDTGLGRCSVLTHNPANGVLHTGHENGLVRLWTPTNQRPVASIRCHSSEILACAIDHRGYQMATSDSNGLLKIWDLRKYEESIESYRSRSRIESIDFSQSGLLAFSTGRTAVIWNLKDSFRPVLSGDAFDETTRKSSDMLLESQKRLYMQHSLERKLISSLKFCPYQDSLGIGHSKGFSSIVIPGSGEANYDVYESNPFEKIKQRDDRIVKQLLDKVRPDMITLDPSTIGGMSTSKTRVELTDQQRAAMKREQNSKFARKNITKSRKGGYKGVLYKRNYKYRHMKHVYNRTQRLQANLDLIRKHKEMKSKQHAMDVRAKVTAKLNQAQSGTSTKKRQSGSGGSEGWAAPSALGRFSKPSVIVNKKQKLIKSRFGKSAKQIYF